MSEPLHPLASEYLDRLRLEARHLPRAQRRELLADIESHLVEATDPSMSDADVLTALDRLGDPEEIVAAEMPAAPGSGPARRAGIHEWAAIFLLLFGGFMFVVGWIAGVVLLWSSPAWRTRDKWIGTLVLPGGLALVPFLVAFAVGTAQKCLTSGARFRLPAVIVTAHGRVPLTHGHLVQTTCTGGGSTASQILGIALLIVAVLAPILTAIHLGLRASRPVAAAV
jgi:hypothetical protein